METSAPKRRRTSPRTAIALQPEPESTTPRDALSRPGSSPSRPSFASPTRATLERYNADILRRRESQPRRLRSSPDAGPSASRAATPDSTRSLTRAMRTQLELRSGARDGGPPTEPGSDGDGILRSPARRPGLYKSPERPIPRPLPPPAPEEDDELLKVISARVNPALSLGVLPEVVAPEPQLPPTPEHPDPVVSTPPTGIHNTPSRRPKRSRNLAEKLKTSSPLKQPPLQPPGLSKKGAIEFRLPTNTSQTRTVSPPLPPPTTAELRGLKPADPDADKKKLRDSLLAEINQLERDLGIASQENERLRQARLSKHNPSPPPNPREILDLLTRHALPAGDQPPKPNPSPVQDWLASALNPIAFLPFHKPSHSGPPTLAQPSTSSTSSDTNLPSHQPLPMTAAEALPYLQVFTPLTFTSHVSPLPPPPNTTDAPLLQHHTITATSASPLHRGLFAARIDMTVNTKTMAVVALAVPKLHPAAAEAELAPLVRRVIVQTDDGGGGKDAAAASSNSSGLVNNISVLAWAMGEWVRVAAERARVWGILEREVGGKDGVREMGRMLRARKERGRKGRRGVTRSLREAGGEEEEGGDLDDEEEDDGVGRVDAAGLLPFVGRTCMDLDVPVLEGGEGAVAALRVQWRIVFDWTGEAKSEIGVLVGVPGKCESRRPIGLAFDCGFCC